MSLLFIVFLVALISLLGALRQIFTATLPVATALHEQPGKLIHPLIEPMFDEAHAQLSALGFALDSHLDIALQPPHLLHAGVVRLYRSADNLTLALVTTTLALEDAADCQLHFYSRDAHSRLCHTAGWSALSPAFNGIGALDTQTGIYADAAAQHAAHRQWLAGRALMPWPDTAACVRFVEAMDNEWLQAMQTRGLLVAHRGALHFTLKGALRLLPALLRRPAQTIADTDAVPPARLALLWEVWQRRKTQTPPRAAVQWGLFAFSALLFFLLGAVYWSVQATALVFAVIALHEAGHWLAMRALGYRDVHMMMLPLTGGVTFGEERTANARDRAWVALLGPLPGVALGALLMPFAAQHPLLAQFALLLVVINLFNLLPVLPLDGGHLLQALLGQRALVWSQAFCAFSVAAMLALAWWQGVAAFAVLALMPFFAWRQLAQQRRWQQAWANQPAPETLLDERLLALRLVAHPARPKAVQRVMLAEQLLRSVNFRAMRDGEGVLIIVLWLAAFLALLLPPLQHWWQVFWPGWQ
ncbi:MAG: site-2 protease family protein [Cardiobacteriaceae bacterium]|nr:site-2 protease family protein [Cardiobacteriaceae bacterium]